MDKKKIQSQYKNKIVALKKFDEFYFDKNEPSVTDEEYDNLKKDIIDLENKYDFLKSKDSPSMKVGYQPSKNFKKAHHKVPMLSLGNAFSEEDLINFEKKIMNYLVIGAGSGIGQALKDSLLEKGHQVWVIFW